MPTTPIAPLFQSDDSADMRNRAARLFAEAVSAADPANAVHAALTDRRSRLEEADRIILIAFGKASIPMCEAALPFVLGKLEVGIAVTTQDGAKVLAGIDTYVGGHPTPDAGSESAARAVEAAVAGAQAGDLVLVLVSGGGSALLAAPAEGLTLEDKIAANDALIGCGAPIDEINVVRRRLSRLKGGGLLRQAAPAGVLSLILSDVPGDDPKSIASGPSVPSDDAPDAALGIVERYGIRDRLPAAVRARLTDDGPAREAIVGAHETVVIGSNRISCNAAERSAARSGFAVERVDGWLGGDVAEAAERLHKLAERLAGKERPAALVAGGETTVVLKGRGTGGRNQELALRFAMLAEDGPIEGDWVFLSGGTDGRDGPTDTAGAIVDAKTLSRMRANGIDPVARLADNDSYPALDAAGALMRTGATGTNVADIQILLVR